VHRRLQAPGCDHGRNTANEASSSGAAAEWQESPEGRNWAEALEDLDIAIAERRCSDAIQSLRKADTDCARPQSIDWSDPDHQTRYRLCLVVPGCFSVSKPLTNLKCSVTQPAMIVITLSSHTCCVSTDRCRPHLNISGSSCNLRIQQPL